MTSGNSTGNRSAYYTLGILFLVSVLAATDRHVLSILVDDIRGDLGITDVQFSLLSGFAFSMCFALFGIPLARLVDQKSRPKILGLAVLVWSLATMLSGFARTFMHLLAARIFVGIGEAVEAPGGTSMVADLFARRNLSKALAVVSLGGLLGSAGALAGGGLILAWGGDTGNVSVPLLGELRAWQLVFILAGLPGLLIGPLLFFTVRDPERQRLMRDADGVPEKVSYGRVLRFIRDQRMTVICTAGGYICYAFAALGFNAWNPSYLIRTHQVSPGTVGVTLGSAQIIIALCTMAFNSWWIDRGLHAGRLDAPLRLSRAYAMIGLAGVLMLPFWWSQQSAFAGVFVVMFANTGILAISVAHARMLPNQIRAQYAATYMLAVQLTAGIFGPLVVASATQYVFADDAAVGKSIALVSGTAFVAAITLLGFARAPFRSTVALYDLPDQPSRQD
ncbi:MFS transporter [Sphingomonas soli]|uniref:MFS transporter n=1 Tax=Sphingomonas soli TaxID=266127 RepID=UPI000834045A|nr:MFS transporter [Sphingomonas soli]